MLTVEQRGMLDAMGITLEEAKSMGITFKRPSKPSFLAEIKGSVEESILASLNALDDEKRNEIAKVEPAFVVSVSVDMLDGTPSKIASKIKSILGKSPSERTWLNVETGKMHSCQALALHEMGKRVNDEVIRRQTRQEDSLRLAWLNADGFPVAWYDAKEKNKVGGLLSTEMRDMVAKANGFDTIPPEDSLPMPLVETDDDDETDDDEA